MTDLLLKNTEELLKQLKSKSCDIQEYLDDNPNSFIEISLRDFWRKMIEKCGMSKSNIINKSDFSYVYFYDVIAGKKIPTSDKIIRLALTMHLSLEECQLALKYSGKAALYPKIKRDSVLIYAIERGFSVSQTQALLYESGEKELK